MRIKKPITDYEISYSANSQLISCYKFSESPSRLRIREAQQRRSLTTPLARGSRQTTEFTAKLTFLNI